MQVSQIECDSTSLPWPGCLQYYMGAEGWVIFKYIQYSISNIQYYFKLNDHLQDIWQLTFDIWHLIFDFWHLTFEWFAGKCTHSTIGNQTTICKTSTTMSASDRRTTCAGQDPWFKNAINTCKNAKMQKWKNAIYTLNFYFHESTV